MTTQPEKKRKQSHPVCPWFQQGDPEHRVTTVAGNGKTNRVSSVDNQYYEGVERYKYKCNLCAKSVVADQNDQTCTVPDPEKTGHWSQLKPCWTALFPSDVVVLPRKTASNLVDQSDEPLPRQKLKASTSDISARWMKTHTTEEFASQDFLSQLSSFWNSMKHFSNPPSEEQTILFFCMHDLTPSYGKSVLSLLQEIRHHVGDEANAQLSPSSLAENAREAPINSPLTSHHNPLPP